MIARFTTKDRLSDTFPNLTVYQYADNSPISKYDFKGDSIIVLTAPSGANGAGHAAVLIGSENAGWKLYSKNGTTENHGIVGASDNDPQNGQKVGKLADYKKNGDSHGNKYTEGYMLTSNSKTDEKMAKAASTQIKKDYVLLGASCIDVCTDALKAGGFNGGSSKPLVTGFSPGSPGGVSTTDAPNSTPNARYQDIKKNNPKGTVVTF